MSSDRIDNRISISAPGTYNSNHLFLCWVAHISRHWHQLQDIASVRSLWIFVLYSSYCCL